jgi:hypothetical protein
MGDGSKMKGRDMSSQNFLRPPNRPSQTSVQGRNAAAAQVMFFTSIGVDLSSLSPMEQTASKMKARRLMQLTDENSQLEITVQQKALQAGGAIPENAAYFVKVIDEVLDEIIIIRVTTNITVENLSSVITRRLERETELMIVTGDDGTQVPIDPQVLRDIQASVLSRARFALTIVAL